MTEPHHFTAYGYGGLLEVAVEALEQAKQDARYGGLDLPDCYPGDEDDWSPEGCEPLTDRARELQRLCADANDAIADLPRIVEQLEKASEAVQLYTAAVRALYPAV
jgi:hypothetical protein